MPHIDPELKRWATARQAEYLDAINEQGSGRKAAAALGVHHRAIQDAMTALKKKAAAQGYAPDHDMTRPAPDPFVVKGVSTYYDSEGQVRGQWVKTALDREAYAEALREWIEWLCAGVKGLVPLIAKPEQTLSDILTVYPMGDPHFGMYAWAEEAGDDFDIDIAERVTCAAIDRLVTSAPASETALLLNLGDFFHADNDKAMTPESGNRLDMDTRQQKVVQVGLRALIHCIRRLLEHHARVIYEGLPGNHDPNASYLLSLCLAQAFHDEPRVTVTLSPSLYRYHRFGKVLIGCHHGHGAKANDLPLLMAADRAKDWGETEHRYWYCGHIHHKSQKESPGVIVETFRTLAAKDAWHAGKGYRSGRDMQCIVHHKEFGEVERHTCSIAMLEGK